LPHARSLLRDQSPLRRRHRKARLLLPEAVAQSADLPPPPSSRSPTELVPAAAKAPPIPLPGPRRLPSLAGPPGDVQPPGSRRRRPSPPTPPAPYTTARDAHGNATPQSQASPQPASNYPLALTALGCERRHHNAAPRSPQPRERELSTQSERFYAEPARVPRRLKSSKASLAQPAMRRQRRCSSDAIASYETGVRGRTSGEAHTVVATARVRGRRRLTSHSRAAVNVFCWSRARR